MDMNLSKLQERVEDRGAWHTAVCGPMDYTVHGVLQARILEWLAILFSRRSSQPRDQTQVSLIARKNERMEPKQNQYPVVDVIGDRSKVQTGKKHSLD